MTQDTPTRPTCATCRFWAGRPAGTARDKGRAFGCRRHAPLPSRGGQHGAEVPYTTHDFWCGEHQAEAQR
jgi:hypothetical protein